MIAVNTTTDVLALPRRILIIDDEESIRTLLDEYLEIVGFEVRTAANGVEGLEIFGDEDFGMVICDVSMPGMDGFEVFERILERKPEQNFLFITGFTFDSAKQDFQKKSLGLLRKPFHLNDLYQIVSNVFPDMRES